jgi:hypothetical protein
MPNEELRPPRTTDERIDAIAMNLELFGHELTTLGRKVDKLYSTVDKLYSIVEIDAENIRRLANIAESHERRLSDLEGPGQQ